MPIYWVFIIAAVIVALFSSEIDKRLNAGGKLRKVIITFCLAIVIILSLVIKIAL